MIWGSRSDTSGFFIAKVNSTGQNRGSFHNAQNSGGVTVEIVQSLLRSAKKIIKHTKLPEFVIQIYKQISIHWCRENTIIIHHGCVIVRASEPRPVQQPELRLLPPRRHAPARAQTDGNVIQTLNNSGPQSPPAPTNSLSVCIILRGSGWFCTHLWVWIRKLPLLILSVCVI